MASSSGMAPLSEAVSDDSDRISPPEINITVETVESVYFRSQWRTSKAYLPLTKDEKAEYYKAYDPIIGVKIAGTLSVLFIMAVLYVLYKSKCKRRKYATDTQLPVEGGAEQQQQTSSCSLHQHPPSTSYTWTLDNSLVHQSCPTGLLVTSEIPVARRQNSCESGRDTPMSNATTHQSVCTVKSPPAHQRHQPSRHYYSDDREMPAWKVYAKELFLYGGPGLWRSASLKGSDPVLLMAQSSFDETINSGGRNHMRSGSLTGSMMGNLGRRDSRRKVSSAHAANTARLQVPTADSSGIPRAHRQYDDFHPDDKTPRDNKKLPSRSVSFRESDMTNYRRGSKRVRTRPGSLRTTRTDYSRLTGGNSSGNVEGNGPNMCQRRLSFRSSSSHSRQASIRSGRSASSTCGTTAQMAEDSSPLPPPSPNSRTVIVHRIPIHQDRSGGNKAMYSRSTSLTTEPARGWRSTIAKLIRAKSTSGNSVGTNNSECSSPATRRKAGHEQTQQQSLQPGDSSRPTSPPRNGESYDGHIDICVIQATPAASPCASIRSTLSGDSLEMTGMGRSVTPPSPPTNMSVDDRRKRFARMKGQTIEAGDANLPIDSTSLLAPPPIDFGPSLLHPVADLRCRSTSPVHPPSSWLQVLQNPMDPMEPFNNRCQQPRRSHSSNKSLSAVDHLTIASTNSLSTHSSSHI